MARVGKYQLLKKLATGEMAEVFLAKLKWARGLERTLVVKRILFHLAEDPTFVEQFFSEASLAAQLNHANIAQIVEFGESEGVYFLAMEYVDGLSLRSLAAAARSEGGISFPCSARIAAFCCEALAYAHDLADAATGKPLNLVHRDVTPDNILISKTGAVKLVDFGIAKAATQKHRTATGLVKGKLAYMSPEQLRAEPVDRRSDIFSLGRVLYELVAGAKPYDARSDVLLVHAMLFDEMVPLRTRRPDVPPELERIINKALERDRDRRYPDCRAMHADLEEYLISSRQPVSTLQLAQLVEKYRPPPDKAESAPPPSAAAPESPVVEPAPAGDATAERPKSPRAETSDDRKGEEAEQPRVAAAPTPPLQPPAPVHRTGDAIRWDVIEEHLDEADFLHGIWEASLRSPDYTLAAIADGPERRLLAHLDGLVLGGPKVAEKLLRPALASKEPGTVFAAAYALLEGQRPADFEALLGALEKVRPEQRSAIRRAMAVVPRLDLGQQLAAVIAQVPAIQVDILEVLGQLRLDPRLPLEPLVNSGRPSMEALAIRLAQVFPDRLDPAAIERAYGSPAPEACSAALETGLVLGSRNAFAACEAMVATRAPGFGTAALLLGLSGDKKSVAALLGALDDEEFQRDVIFALGFSGQVSVADKLLDVMDDETLAPLAAEAFSAITGLRVEKVFAVSPEPWNPDQDADELLEEVGVELPQPDPDEIARWWKDTRPKLDPTPRWLRGQPWSAAALLRELEHGPARRREALALDLAIRSRGQVQIAWNGLTSRQRKELQEARTVRGRLHKDSYRNLGPLKSVRSPPGPTFVVARAGVHRTTSVPASALAITGIGMVTSLGWGAAPVCAALRAGLARPSPLDYTVVDSEEASAAEVVGHPLEGFEGYEGLALHVKMAAAAIEDLREAVGPGQTDSALWDDLALLCATAPTRAEEGEVLDELMMEELADRVAATLPVEPVETAVVLSGHVAGLGALAAAAEVLKSRRADRVLVVATDRLVGKDDLTWLEAREALKTPENPVGVAPGQAAVAMLVETPAAAKRRRAEVLGFVETVARGAREEGQPPGRALANAILRVWPANAQVGDLYGDLNGLSARAYEWGSAQVHIAPRRPLERSSLQFPALGLGDTGAASGLISVGMALRDYARGWARSERAIVWSQSDLGGVAAALITPPAAQDDRDVGRRRARRG